MFKVINGGKLPERATKFAAGFDVFANEDIVIGAGETCIVPLGIAIDQDELHFVPDVYMDTHYLELHPRSSIRAKGLGGGVGIIDLDYKDEIKMVIHNPISYITHTINHDLSHRGVLDLNKYKINKGDRIGQLLLKRHDGYLLSDSYTKNVERTGGFGSTGK